jgi:O-acetyl-ADP-ribose deacetylase (regulator of RNase III)
MEITYIKGDLIKLAKEGYFDVICHQTNCFNTQNSGLAPQMAKSFGTHLFDLERGSYAGDINKLGCIDYEKIVIDKECGYYIATPVDDLFEDRIKLYVVNCYGQYHYGKNHNDGVEKPVDYDAIRLCMRKINHIFKGKTIGLPRIGCGLAGGDWNIVSKIITEELKGMEEIIVVEYEK